MFLKKISLFGLGGTVVGVYGLDRAFPAEKSKYNIGDKVKIDGTEKKVIGYVGANIHVFENGLNLDQGVYYTVFRKKGQGYGLRRAIEAKKGGNEAIPTVGILAADYPPKQKDHTPGIFEGHDPLSPKYLKKAKVVVIHTEEVTKDNREGLFGNIERLREYAKKKV